MVNDLEEEQKEQLQETKKEEKVDIAKEEETLEITAEVKEQEEETSTTQDKENQSTTPTQKTCLSTALKTGTSTAHASAEDVHFVRNFIRGKIDKTLYTHLVTSLYHIYETLEEELSIHAPTHFPTLHFPKELNRVESLEDDLDFYFGETQWKIQVKNVYENSQATVDYCNRIRYIAKYDPLLLLSHAYTRYLGDLSGGRILARVARKALNLKGGDDGLRFYMFEHVSNPKSFKEVYRLALDELDLEYDQVERLVAEANVAFALNVRVFEELDVMGGLEGAT
eukprot:4119439-Ditylum_brightwellii.AAC.1